MIVRDPTVAWSRRQRGDGDDEPAAKPAEGKPDETKPRKDEETAPLAMKPADAKKPEPAKPEPAAKPAEPEHAVPVEVPRATTQTIAMPALDIGKPPEMPSSVAPPPLVLGTVEDPTHMPGPKDIPAGEPGDRAPAPGLVPRGDSRSLRRGGEFALIYRVGTYVISRFGSVGERGQWRVVEYPTTSFAGTAYAKECSRFVSEGFSDYRG
jgi:hypothetical protein